MTNIDGMNNRSEEMNTMRSLAVRNVSGMVCVTAAVIVFAVSTAHGAIVTPTGVTVSSTSAGSGTYLIDNSGIQSPPADPTDKHAVWDFNMWLSNWGDVASATITFDLGSDYYYLNSAVIWNWSSSDEEGTNIRSTKDFRLLVSLDDVTYTPVTNTLTLSQPTYSAGYTIDSQTFATSYSGLFRYVQVDILSSYGSDAAGLAEVRFDASIPEPASIVFLAFGGLLLSRRRLRARRR